MKNGYYPQRDKWLRIAVAILVVAGIVAGIIAISRCSKHKPHLFTDTIDTQPYSLVIDTGLIYFDTGLIYVFWEKPDPESSDTYKLGKALTVDTLGEALTVDTENYVIKEKTGKSKGNHYGERRLHDKKTNDASEETKDQYGNDGEDDSGNEFEPTPKKKRGNGRKIGERLDPPREPQILPDMDPPSFQQPSVKGRNPININKPVWVVVLIILLIVYIFAEIISRGGTLILFVTPLDKVLVIVSACLYFIAWLVDSGHGFTAFQTTLFSLSGLLMLVSVTLSIIYNKFNILNIALSILAKLFYFVFVNIMLLLFIVVALVYILIKIARNSP